MLPDINKNLIFGEVGKNTKETDFNENEINNILFRFN